MSHPSHARARINAGVVAIDDMLGAICRLGRSELLPFAAVKHVRRGCRRCALTRRLGRKHGSDRLCRACLHCWRRSAHDRHSGRQLCDWASSSAGGSACDANRRALHFGASGAPLVCTGSPSDARWAATRVEHVGRASSDVQHERRAPPSGRSQRKNATAERVRCSPRQWGPRVGANRRCSLEACTHAGGRRTEEAR